MATQAASTDNQTNWPIQLFNKSVLKQRKYQEITAMLGDFRNKHCLDIGADNGVISYLLRDFWKDFHASIEDTADLRIGDVIHAMNVALAPLIYSGGREFFAAVEKGSFFYGDLNLPKWPGRSRRARRSRSMLKTESARKAPRLLLTALRV